MAGGEEKANSISSELSLSLRSIKVNGYGLAGGRALIKPMTVMGSLKVTPNL